MEVRVRRRRSKRGRMVVTSRRPVVKGDGEPIISVLPMPEKFHPCRLLLSLVVVGIVCTWWAELRGHVLQCGAGNLHLDKAWAVPLQPELRKGL